MLKRFFTPKWQHQDLIVREQTLLSLDNDADVEIIKKMVIDDPSAKLRDIALEKLTDTIFLESQLTQAENPAKWLRYAVRLNALSPSSNPLQKAFCKAKNDWPKDDTINALIHCKEQKLAVLLLAIFDDPEALLMIATSAKSIDQRLKAVSEISNEKHLRQLSKGASNKQVLRAARLKLNDSKQQQKNIENTLLEAEHLAGTVIKLSQQTWLDTHFQIKIKHLCDKWQRLNIQLIDNGSPSQQEQYQKVKNTFDHALQSCQMIIEQHRKEIEKIAIKQETLSKQGNLYTQLEALNKEIEDPSELTFSSVHSIKNAFSLLNNSWQQIIETPIVDSPLSTKYINLKQSMESYFNDWDNVYLLQPRYEQLCSNQRVENFHSLDKWISDWEQLELALKWPKNKLRPGFFAPYQKFADEVHSKYDKTKRLQKNNAKYVTQKLDLLRKHCQQKNLIAANKLSNYINVKMSELVGDFQTNAFKKLESIQPQLDELRDWHIFATTPKKLELCESMENIASQQIKPLEKAKLIRKLQEKWRELVASHSTSDEELWERFKQSSKTAYLPCQEYYQEKDKIRALNLEQCVKICESLEELVTKSGWKVLPEEEILDDLDNNLDWKTINQTLIKSRQDWKSNQPIPENERASIQNRYNTLSSTVKKHLHNEKQSNLEKRIELVAKVEKLLTLEDINQSIQDVKHQQKQWKELGITFYKADREQWKLFRAAIDRIFTKRKQLNLSDKNQLLSNQQSLKMIIEKINQLRKINDLQLRKSYEEFEDLRDSWDPDTKLPNNRSTSLLNDFKNSCLTYQEHYQSLEQRLQNDFYHSLINAAELLHSLENDVLQNKTPALKQENFKNIEIQITDLLSAPRVNKLLSPRFQQLLACKQFTENQIGVSQLKELALHSEIMLGIDSPDSEKQQRMTIQLEQLQQKYRISISDAEKRTNVLGMLETWVNIGFISNLDRKELESRRHKIILTLRL